MTGVDAMLHRRRRVRNRWIATATLIAVPSIGLAVWSRGSLADEPGTPTEAVQQYVDAIVGDDLARAWDLMCESQQEEVGSKSHFFSDEGRPRFMLDGRRIAGEAVAFEPFPVKAWRVSYHREQDLGRNSQELVIRENGHLRVCGDPQYLYE